MFSLDELRAMVPACFGSEDRIFAGHPADSQRARGLLSSFWESDFSFEDFEQIIRDYLVGLECSDEHIEEQMGRVRDIEVYF